MLRQVPFLLLMFCSELSVLFQVLLWSSRSRVWLGGLAPEPAKNPAKKPLKTRWRK